MNIVPICSICHINIGDIWINYQNIRNIQCQNCLNSFCLTNNLELGRNGEWILEENINAWVFYFN